MLLSKGIQKSKYTVLQMHTMYLDCCKGYIWTIKTLFRVWIIFSEVIRKDLGRSSNSQRVWGSALNPTWRNWEQTEGDKKLYYDRCTQEILTDTNNWWKQHKLTIFNTLLEWYQFTRLPSYVNSPTSARLSQQLPFHLHFSLAQYIH